MEDRYSECRNTSTSGDIRALGRAMLLSKKKFNATGLGGKNSHQGYRYAKIEDIYDAVEDALSENNIWIVHFAAPDGDKEYLYTLLVHTLTGQYIQDCRLLSSEKPGNQGKVAASTYMRKAAVLSLCAIPTEDDDQEEEQKHIEKNNPEPIISHEQLIYLQEQIKLTHNPVSTFKKVLSFNNIEKLDDLKAKSFESVKSYIEKSKK